MEQHHKAAGAWIPAYILYNDSLSWKQKGLYAVIHNLCNQKGYCWASNEYLAEYFQVSEATIKRDIKALRDCQAIVTHTEPTKTGTRRIIEIPQGGRLKNELGGRLKNELHNNIDINNSKPVNGISGQLFNNGKDLGADDNALALKLLYQETKNRHAPKSVRGQRVTWEEARDAEIMFEKFNEVRSVFTAKPSNIIANKKAWSQAIELVRDGINRDEVEDVLYAMFEADYHKENNWQHITPEFLTRIDKFQKYKI